MKVTSTSSKTLSFLCIFFFTSNCYALYNTGWFDAIKKHQKFFLGGIISGGVGGVFLYYSLFRAVTITLDPWTKQFLIGAVLGVPVGAIVLHFIPSSSVDKNSEIINSFKKIFQKDITNKFDSFDSPISSPQSHKNIKAAIKTSFLSICSKFIDTGQKANKDTTTILLYFLNDITSILQKNNRDLSQMNFIKYLLDETNKSPDISFIKGLITTRDLYRKIEIAANNPKLLSILKYISSYNFTHNLLQDLVDADTSLYNYIILHRLTKLSQIPMPKRAMHEKSYQKCNTILKGILDCLQQCTHLQQLYTITYLLHQFQLDLLVINKIITTVNGLHQKDIEQMLHKAKMLCHEIQNHNKSITIYKKAIKEIAVKLNKIYLNHRLEKIDFIYDAEKSKFLLKIKAYDTFDYIDVWIERIRNKRERQEVLYRNDPN